MARYGVKTLKTLVFDVIFQIVDKVFDSLLIYNYYLQGNYTWMGLTIFAISLPGLFELIYFFLSLRRRSYTCLESFNWTVMFGPFLFPISNIGWNFIKVCRGDKVIKKYYPMSMVVGSIQAFSESIFQFTLQTYVMMTTWTKFGDFYLQLITSVNSLCILAKTSVDHHYFEVNAKQRMCSFHNTLPAILIYISHIFFRVFTIALLSSYLHYWSIIPLLVFLFFNFCLTMMLRTDRGKRIWTTLSSIATPVCFVSRNDVTGNSSRKFHNFYKANTVLFALVSVVSLIITNICLNYNQLSFGCHNIPFLSCHEDLQCEKTCGITDFSTIEAGQHFDFHLFGSIMVVAMSTLHLIAVWFQNNLIPTLAKSNHSFMDPL